MQTALSNNYQQIAPILDTMGNEAMPQMDPKLCQAIVLKRNGYTKSMTSSTAENELAVIAKVDDASAWSELSEVRSPKIICKVDEGKSTIVTGRIPIARIEFLRRLPFVKSMKAARKLTPALQASIPDIEAATYLGPGKTVTGGKGVVVGIIDGGCDFAHHNFIVSGKKTRIKKFWDQTNDTTAAGTLHGKIYDAALINKALAKQDPYAALGYHPGMGSHGTHVMDIAAGNGKGTGTAGVAPQAELIFVQLDSADAFSAGPESLRKNFGDSVNLVDAIRFIFDEAAEQPCVINISLGTNGGPHDGSTLVEQSIDSMVSEKPNRCVVIAASNSFTDGIHASGDVISGAPTDLDWILTGKSGAENEMEIWYKKDDRIAVEIFDPTGKSLGQVEPGESGTVKDAAGEILLVANNRLDDPNNHDNVIGLWLKDTASGKWKIRLTNMNAAPASFHGWIEREDSAQSNFGNSQKASHTLGSISCSHLAITVASYDVHDTTTFPASWFSSAGPTRDGREKPEISAPGGAIIAANSGTFTGLIKKSGTSMAAPAVAGAIALLYSELFKNKAQIQIKQLREMIEKCGRTAPPVAIWSDRYGFGRISVPLLCKAIQQVPGLSVPNPVKKKSAQKAKKTIKKKKNS